MSARSAGLQLGIVQKQDGGAEAAVNRQTGLSLPDEVLLLFRSGLGRGGGRRRILLRRMVALHAFLEFPDALAEAAHQFGNFPAAKQNHDHEQQN